MLQVVVLLLLVAGLALLVMGLITGSTPLVVGSIAASLLAAYLIARVRRNQASAVDARGTSGAAAREARDPAKAPERAQVGAAAELHSPVLAPAAAPAAHLPAGRSGPDGGAAGALDTLVEPADPVDPEDPSDPEPAAADTDPPLRTRGDEPVWVIDGRPRYHLAECGFLPGRQPEPVPLRQAVEDGFSPCALCDPDSGLAAG